jgi:chromosome segregation ATPase
MRWWHVCACMWQAAQRLAEVEQVASGLREDAAQLGEENGTLKARLEHSEAQAQKLQVENRAMRAQLESAADSGATETERLAEVQLENSELMGAVMEARAATSQAEALARSEKAAADKLREDLSGVDSQLAAARQEVEEQKVAVQQLTEELEALSEAVVDDAGGAEKIEELEMIVEELENQVTHNAQCTMHAHQRTRTHDAARRHATRVGG